MAFFALAVPGIVMALLVRFTLKEPSRGALDPVARFDAPSLMQTLRFIRGQHSLMHVLAAATVVTYWGWGLLWWTPAFLMRSHHMTTGDAGMLTGTISGIGGAVGIIAGGILTQRLSAKDARWQVWVVAIGTFIATFASIGVYAVSDIATTRLLLCLFVPVAYLNLAPILSLTQSLVLPQMRALTCAIMIFGANIANLALAPQLIGIMSDLMRKWGAGPSSLRFALILSGFTGFWASYHFWAAGRRIRSDLQKVGAVIQTPLETAQSKLSPL